MDPRYGFHYCPVNRGRQRPVFHGARREKKRIDRRVMCPPHVRPTLQFPDAYYKSSKFVLWVGVIIGVFPVFRNSEGTYQFRWISMSTLYSIFIYILTSCAVTYSMYVKILNFRDPELPFDEYPFTLIFVFILSSHWLVQVVSLPSSKAVGEYLTMWNGFEKHFLLVTGRAIKLDYKLEVIAALSFGTIMAVVIPIIQTTIIDTFSLRESVAFYHTLLLYTFLCLWWSLQCNAFICSVRCLRESMRKELAENAKYVDMRRYRELWEHVYALMEKMSWSVRHLYGVYNFLTYGALFLTVYCAFSQMLSNHTHFRTLLFIGLLNCAAYFFAHLYKFCNSAHFLREEITDAVINDLQQLRLCELSKINAREVDLFVSTINVKKVGLVVSGNFAIGRRTLTNYGSSMAMYCLVLLQFKITLPRPAY